MPCPGGEPSGEPSAAGIGPVVVLGADKNDRARSRFDGAHELGHLVVHGHQIWGVKEVEHQAHAFAAAFLMPAGDIRDELPDRADWTVLSLPQGSLPSRSRLTAFAEQPHSGEIPWWPR